MIVSLAFGSSSRASTAVRRPLRGSRRPGASRVHVHSRGGAASKKSSSSPGASTSLSRNSPTAPRAPERTDSLANSQRAAPPSSTRVGTPLNGGGTRPPRPPSPRGPETNQSAYTTPNAGNPPPPPRPTSPLDSPP